MAFDAHCHLTDPRFDGDIEEVVARAQAVGVTASVTAGTDLESSAAAANLASRFKSVYAAAGIHPSEAHRTPPDFLETLTECVRRPKVVAIGEIGLDFYHPGFDRQNQEKIFGEQLSLAHSLSMPVVIHSRKAEREALELVLASGVKRALFHCYTGGVDTAHRILSAGFLLGVAGIATFGDPEFSSMVAGLPVTGLLSETDAPYLSPAPFRGKRNEPANVIQVVKKIADLHPGQKAAEVESAIEANARRFYNIP